MFAIAAGWVGIPRTFPLLGQLSHNWFGEFVGSMIPQAEAESHSLVPLFTSLVVSLGGLYLGWRVYRGQEKGAPDPLAGMLGGFYTVLKNKYYVDEFYSLVFIKPARWIAETFVSSWMDRKVIDGVLHAIGNFGLWLGQTLRSWFDLPVINGAGDALGKGTRGLGKSMKGIQTGRVQQYMVMAVLVLAVIGLVFYYFLVIV